MSNYLYYDYLHSKVCKVKEDTITMEKGQSCIHYMNQMCLEKGSSFQGRKDSFSKCMKVSRFIPIVIDQNHIYIPLSSMKDAHCIWVNYHEIMSIQPKEKMCILHFRDHTHLVCYHPQRIIRNMQLVRQYLQMF